jgi:hypothetical protein
MAEHGMIGGDSAGFRAMVILGNAIYGRRISDWFKKALNRTMRTTRRITSINIPIGGVQWSLPIDASFGRAQDEWELRREIYLWAGIEAYGAKDGARRLGELMVPEVHAVEKYLAMNPEMRRWVECNIEAGTCGAAVAELRNKKEQFRQARLVELGDVPKRKPNPEFDWMRQAAQGNLSRVVH